MPSGSNELAADSHLRLGITWAGFLKFLRCELRFINPGDFLVQKAIRRTDDENWVTQSFGPIRSLKYAASGSTGYDVCGHIRCWLKGRSAEKQSVCEVLRGQGGEWTDHIGDANVFYSHLQKPSISDTLASMRLGMDVHESRLPPEQDCYFWIDYLCVRQCLQDFDVHVMQLVIAKAPWTMAEIDHDFEYPLRSFCVFEAWAAVHSGRTLLCITRPQHRRFLDNTPINAAVALARKSQDKQQIDSFIAGTVGFPRLNSVVSEAIYAAHRFQFPVLYNDMLFASVTPDIFEVHPRLREDEYVVQIFRVRERLQQADRARQAEAARTFISEVWKSCNFKDGIDDGHAWLTVASQIVGGNFRHWCVTMHLDEIICGNVYQSTPFAGGTFVLDVHFPQDFPMHPPRMRFVNKMYHANVSPSGEICLDLLSDEKWSPSYHKMMPVFMAIVGLLDDPNAADALNPDAADMLDADRKQGTHMYRDTVQEWTKKYAP